MDSANLSDLRKSLATLSSKELRELCLKLARYKKENKELLSYLLYFSGNERDYITGVQEEIRIQFEGLNLSNSYLATKGIRKILRMVNKFAKYSANRQTEVELLIYFCLRLKNCGVRLYSGNTLSKLYERQLVRIAKAITLLHEDLQFDYGEELKKLIL